MILHPELATSWQGKFIGLDISSFSALTLAVFLTRLAYGGGKNTIRFFQRDGQPYFGRAYRSVLFSEGFETLCVRFGLLGTLLSFLLAAVAQMSNDDHPTTSASGTTHGGRSQCRRPRLGGFSGCRRQNAGRKGAGGERATSRRKIFLSALRQSRVNVRGNRCRLRRHPQPQLAQRTGGRLASAGTGRRGVCSRRVLSADFPYQPAAGRVRDDDRELTEAAEHISNFEVSVATAAGQLVKLIAGLERAIQTFDVSTQTGKQLARKLDHLEAMSDKLSALLDRLPERLNDPLKNMSLMAKEFRDAAVSGETAFRELKEVAGSARGPLSETTQRTNTTWQMLRELQDSLRELAKSEERADERGFETGPGV